MYEQSVRRAFYEVVLEVSSTLQPQDDCAWYNWAGLGSIARIHCGWQKASRVLCTCLRAVSAPCISGRDIAASCVWRVGFVQAVPNFKKFCDGGDGVYALSQWRRHRCRAHGDRAARRLWASSGRPARVVLGRCSMSKATG